VSLAAIAAARLGGGDLGGAGLLVYEVGVGASVLGLAVDLRRGDWAASAVAGLVADLGTLEMPGALSERLAKALGDPGLAVAIRARDGWVDAGGASIAEPVAGPGQVLTPIEDAGVLVHDAVLLEQPALLRGAVAAARLAVDNARLEAEVRASVTEVAASRRRLVEAGDDQRRRLERELRDSAERELDAATAATAALGAPYAALTEEMRRAREELRRFAHGVHPALLTEHGLARALDEVARRMPIRVDVQVDPRHREPLLEITAYYVCTEALANAVKHAQAGEARVRVIEEHGRLRVEVADDGVGGARLDGGGGLRGLGDRVAAVGGTLQVRSPPGAGTRVVAVLPL
jgi:signal transduction histidine kinase